jgi:hypothetical protein
MPLRIPDMAETREDHFYNLARQNVDDVEVGLQTSNAVGVRQRAPLPNSPINLGRVTPRSAAISISTVNTEAKKL